MSSDNLLFEGFAHGKLLITGEYVVLDGALAYAIPTQAGQWLRVYSTQQPHWLWQAFDHRGRCWFTATLEMSTSVTVKQTNEPQAAAMLCRLLQAAGFAGIPAHGLHIKTQLTFDKFWGWGTSSTLVALVGRWLGTNPYRLLAQTFGGSGYDIACADADTPILYQRKQDPYQPYIERQTKQPVLDQCGYIVWLGHKQNSRSAIAQYNQKRNHIDGEVFDSISKQVAASKDYDHTVALLQEHETLMGQLLHRPSIQKANFRDFAGVVKSLGAWGGDCVLAISNIGEAGVRTYFQQRGFGTVLPVAHALMPV
jgi:mevalonate kinase